MVILRDGDIEMVILRESDGGKLQIPPTTIFDVLAMLRPASQPFK
jgi:hypothetical protein